MNEQTAAIRFPRAKADPILNELLPKLARFQALLRQHDSDVEIDSAAAREAWAALAEPVKRASLLGFSGYLENCEETVRSGISLRDNYALLSHSLKRANLFATENVQGFLTSQNIAEVYNLDHIQTFRSINFFDLCNYSLLDLLAREWFVLYERLSSITDQAMREFQMALEAKELRRLTIPVHLLKERDSNPRGVFRFDFQYCCPLFSAPGVLGGYLLTENVTELDLFAPGDESFTFLR
jgi:hypothetical protein